MMIRYCTPEWLEESARLYKSTDSFKNMLKKVTTKIFYRVTAEPAWGIDKDILFGVVVEEGELLELSFFCEEVSKEISDFILAATPQIWKGILRKDTKFITEFMLGKVTLESGSKSGLLLITPYANHLVSALTQFELVYPDELSEDELTEYRSDLAAFREKSGV